MLRRPLVTGLRMVSRTLDITLPKNNYFQVYHVPTEINVAGAMYAQTVLNVSTSAKENAGLKAVGSIPLAW